MAAYNILKVYIDIQLSETNIICICLKCKVSENFVISHILEIRIKLL